MNFLIDGNYLYEVRYIVVSGSEKKVEEKYIRLKNETIENEKRSLSVRGRCRVEHCPCFIRDCGHIQESELDLNLNGNGAILIKSIKEKLLNKELKKNLLLKLKQDEKEKELSLTLPVVISSFNPSIVINKQEKINKITKDKVNKDKKIKKSRISSIPIKNAGKGIQRNKIDLMKQRPQSSNNNGGKVQNLCSLMSMLHNDRIHNFESNYIDISNNNGNSSNNSNISSSNSNSNNNNYSNKIVHSDNIATAKKLYNMIASKSTEEFDTINEATPGDLKSMYTMIQELDYNTTFELLEYSNEKLIEASEKCILFREKAIKYNKNITENKQLNQKLNSNMKLKITLLTKEFDKLDLQTERSACDIFDKAFKHLLVIKKIEKNTISRSLQKIRNIKKTNVENSNNNIRDEWRTERCDANEAINILHENYYGYLLINLLIYYFILCIIIYYL